MQRLGSGVFYFFKSPKLGLKEGDQVWITSPYYKSKVRALVRSTILCQKGVIDAQYGWRGDQETQVLIPRKNWDPISGYPCPSFGF